VSDALLALLVQVDGEAEARVFTGDFTIGNQKGDCTVQLADEYISNRHVRFYQEGGGWWAEDMGSVNGTYFLPEHSRRYGPVLLGRGDKVRIGRTILTVVPAG
jgi:pSer/pThr/pTyr-binding forkhead associated (FHA) protein